MEQNKTCSYNFTKLKNHSIYSSGTLFRAPKLPLIGGLRWARVCRHTTHALQTATPRQASHSRGACLMPATRRAALCVPPTTAQRVLLACGHRGVVCDRFWMLHARRAPAPLARISFCRHPPRCANHAHAAAAGPCAVLACTLACVAPRHGGGAAGTHVCAENKSPPAQIRVAWCIAALRWVCRPFSPPARPTCWPLRVAHHRHRRRRSTHAKRTHARQGTHARTHTQPWILHP